MKTLISFIGLGLIILLIGCKKERIEPDSYVIHDLQSGLEKLGPYKLLYTIRPDFVCTSILKNEKKFEQGFHFSISSNKYYDSKFILKIGDRNFTLNNNAPELDISGFANDNSQIDYEMKREFFLENFCGKDLDIKYEVGDKIIVEDKLHFASELCLEPLAKVDNPKLINTNLFIRNKLKIEFNRDPGNKEGLLAIVIWSGTSIYDKLDETYYKLEKPLYTNIYFTNDDGHLDFPKDAFSQIPNGAIIYIGIHRSTIRKYDVNGKVHFFRFESNEQINGVLMDE